MNQTNWSHTTEELARAIGAQYPHRELRFSGVSTDTRTLKPGDVFFALRGERYDANQFLAQAFEKGAYAAVTTEPHPAGPCLVVEDTLKALQQFAQWHRSQYDIGLLALTGSCGKTSTKDMIGALLGTRHRVVKTEGNLNNEIGCPLSLLRIDGNTDMAVIEVGANHGGEIARLVELAKPNEAAITMIAPAHLEGFGSIENVAKAKGEVAQSLPEDGVFYVNMDDAWCRRVAEGLSCRKVSFGHNGDVSIKKCRIDEDGEMQLVLEPVGELKLPLPCRAHALNVALTVAVALQHGIKDFEEPLRAACQQSVRFKLERIGGFEIIDDTYNANPASMSAALHTLAERPANKRVAVLGDMLELGEAARDLHVEIGALAGQLRLDAVFARGEFAHAVVAAAKKAGVPQADVIRDHADIATALMSMEEEQTAVLVKGSRGMKMERVIQALREK